MKTNLFESQDYKEILRHEIQANSEQRGYHTRIAKVAGCQSSFLSQVLNGHVHLTPDHASGIADFWRLDEAQEDYFYLTVQLARAGNLKLKSYLKRKMDEIRRQQSDIAKRVKGDQISDLQEGVQYYSAWYWSAIHVIASLPHIKTVEQIARRLQLPQNLVERCVNTLLSTGLLTRTNGVLAVTQRHLHLPKDSPLLGIHHLNWRQQAGVHATLRNHESIQYSAVHTLSLGDIEKIKSLMLEYIAMAQKIVTPSPEEDIIYMGLDLFKL